MKDRPRSSRPDPLTEAAYLEGRLTGRARATFEAYLAEDDAARRAMLLLGAVEEEMPEELAVPRDLLALARALGVSRRRRRRWLLAAAAVAFAGITLAGWYLSPWRSGRAPGPTVMRDLPGDSIAAITPAAGTLVEAGELVFRWMPVDGADRYEIVVWSPEDGISTLLHAAGDQHRILWPADRPPPRPGPLFWRIRALRAGRLLDESRPVPFEVRP